MYLSFASIFFSVHRSIHTSLHAYQPLRGHGGIGVIVAIHLISRKGAIRVHGKGRVAIINLIQLPAIITAITPWYLPIQTSGVCI